MFYQPSATFKLPFPCIIYSRIGIDKNHADNYTPGYQRVDSYRVVVIDKDPDSPIVENIINNVKYCKYSNTINQDNMYQTHFIAKLIT